MVKKEQDHAAMALRALIRAPQKAMAEAKRKNLKVPIWIDGKIEYIDSEIDPEQFDSADPQSRAFLGATDPWRLTWQKGYPPPWRMSRIAP